MEKEYNAVLYHADGYYEEKKSKFYSDVFPLSGEEEVEQHMQLIRKKYYDASHHCYAYTLCKRQEYVKCSDAGEPQGTAGYPMLSVLQGLKVCDCLVVVTRYFGGTLLGTGGLVRSYTKAAQSALDHAVIAHKKLSDLLLIETDYGGYGRLQYYFEKAGLLPSGQEFTDKVAIQLPVFVDDTERVIRAVTEETNGRARIEKLKQIYAAAVGRETMLFDS